MLTDNARKMSQELGTVGSIHPCTRHGAIYLPIAALRRIVYNLARCFFTCPKQFDGWVVLSAGLIYIYVCVCVEAGVSQKEGRCYVDAKYRCRNAHSSTLPRYEVLANHASPYRR